MPGSLSPAPSAPEAPPTPRGWRALLDGHRPVYLLCALVIVLGLVFRAWDLANPPEFSFDERHFVKHARRYLEGRKDGNDHPPLGKLLISASIALFGDRPEAWRVPALIAGVANIALAGALGRALFRDRLAGVLVAALVAMEGFLLVYARTALLDGVLVSLFLGCALALVSAKRPWHIALAATLAGMATCVKFSGIVLIVPLVAALVATRPALPWWTGATLLLMPVTYGAIFSFALHITDRPAGPVGVVNATWRLFELHLGKSDWENRWVSHWYTWFVPTRPVILRWAREGNVVQAMTTLGNMATWWASEALVLGAFWSVLRAGPRALAKGAFLARLRGEADGAGFFGGNARAIGWLCLLWLLPLVPWMISKRDAYVYHYLPSYTFGVVLLGGGLAWLFRTRPRWAWLALGVITAVFALYTPVWIELPIPRGWYRSLVFLKMWR